MPAHEPSGLGRAGGERNAALDRRTVAGKRHEERTLPKQLHDAVVVSRQAPAGQSVREAECAGIAHPFEAGLIESQGRT